MAAATKKQQPEITTATEENAQTLQEETGSEVAEGSSQEFTEPDPNHSRVRRNPDTEPNHLPASRGVVRETKYGNGLVRRDY